MKTKQAHYFKTSLSATLALLLVTACAGVLVEETAPDLGTLPGATVSASPTPAEPTPTPMEASPTPLETASPTAATPTPTVLAAITLYLAGDSTVADYSQTVYAPQSGWGESLGGYLSPQVTVANHAKGGTSTKSFRDQGRWAAILALLQPGDWVLIQFGHNDEKADYPDRYADPATFKANLITMVGEVRAKGAHPLLLTPLQRRKFTNDVYDATTHGTYPTMTQEAASETGTALVDLHALSTALNIQLGAEGTKAVYNFIAAGQHPNYPFGIEDSTHLNTYGSRRIAQLIAGAIMQGTSGLAPYIDAQAVAQQVPQPTPYPTPSPGASPAAGAPILRWTFEALNADNSVNPDAGSLLLKPGTGTKPIFSVVAGRVGNAVRLANDASTATWNYYKTDSSDVFNLYNSGFSVEMWVKFESMTYASNPILFEYRNGTSGAEYGYKAELDAASGKVRLRLYNGTAVTITGATALTAGNWYHIMVTWEAGAGYLFVNGALDGSGLGSVGSNTGDNLIVAGGATSSDKNVKGVIDQLSIWNYAMDPNLIAARYSNPQ